MSDRTYINLLHVTQMFAVWGGLLAWRWMADRIGCAVSALFIVPLCGVIMLAASEVALFKRHAFITQYLSAESVLARLLRRKTILILWQGIKALLFTLILLVSALSFDVQQWLVLLADILIMTVLLSMFTRLLHREVRSSYRGPLARHWAHWANTLLLWLISIVVMFFSAQEDYTGMTWNEVVRFSASNVLVACDAIAVLTRINAVSEALAWWAAQNFLVALERPAQALMAWLAFVAIFGLSFISAWAYSRALAGVLSRPWRVVATTDKFSTPQN